MPVRFLLAVLVLLVACGGSFAPQTQISSVRVILTKADKPFARPGDTVQIEALALDERAIKPKPMKNYWIPFACINPRDDLYYACFSALAPKSGPPGSMPMGLPSFLQPGAEITGFLKEGTTFPITLPADIITTHAPTPGAEAPYGVAFVFFIACAGHVRIANVDPNSQNPQLKPILCTDDDGKELSPDDYVFAFTRVYAYDKLVNTNPVITNVTIDGAPIDPMQGITVTPCTGERTGPRSTCKTYQLAAEVPDTSWEPSLDQHEAVYSTFYYTEAVGDFDADGKLLFDAAKGKIADHAVKLIPKATVGEGKIWVIVQDSRGGAAWVELPVHVK